MWWDINKMMIIQLNQKKINNSRYNHGNELHGYPVENLVNKEHILHKRNIA